MEKEEQANKLSELRSKWASMLSKCSPKELLDIESDVSDRANRDNIVYVYSSDVDAGDIVAGGARRVKGTLLTMAASAGKKKNRQDRELFRPCYSRIQQMEPSGARNTPSSPWGRPSTSRGSNPCA